MTLNRHKWQRLKEKFDNEEYSDREWEVGIDDEHPTLMQMIFDLHKRIEDLEDTIKELRR